MDDLKYDIFKNGSIRQVTVDCRDSYFIEDLLMKLINDYHADYSEYPVYLILGPVEHAQLSYRLSRLKYSLYSQNIDHVSSFLGIPIIIKENPGIELGVSRDIELIKLHEVKHKDVKVD